MSEMDLMAAINLACKELPEGWEIRLHIEKGAANVELEDLDGERDAVMSVHVDEGTVAEDIEEALRIAKEEVKQEKENE